MTKDVKNKFIEFYQPASLARAVAEKPTNHKLIGALDEIVAKEHPELAPLAGTPSDQISALSETYAKNYGDRLTKYVDENLGDLVNDVVNEDNALSLVLGFEAYAKGLQSDLVKEIKQDIELLQASEKNPKAVLAIAGELMKYDDNGFLEQAMAYILRSGNHDWVLRSFKNLIEVKQRNLISKFSLKEGEKSYLNIGAVKNYVVDNLRATPDKEKIEAYTKFADIVAGTYVKEAQEKAAKNAA